MMYFVVDTANPIDASIFGRLKQFDIVVAASCTGAMVFMVANNPVKDGYISFNPSIASKRGQTNKLLNIDDSLFEKIVGGAGAPAGAIYAYPSGSYTYSIGDADSATGSCSTDNPQNCALLLNNRELLEGVQDFQVEFGRQSASRDYPDLQFLSADADILTDAHLGWGAIDRIRITMVFNSIGNAPTNEGSQLITKKVTRIFAVANQLMSPD